MSVRSSAIASQRGVSWLATAAIGVMLLCWIVGNPRSSGPDEPSHMVASAGFVRGQGTGEPTPDDPSIHLMQVPAMVGQPNPGCWAQHPDAPVNCTSLPPETEITDRPTTSFNYPVWGLVLPGLASYVPSAAGYAYLARAANAIVVLLLLAWTLRKLFMVRPVLASAALLGVTPIAWFTFGTVNPSSIAIAGGLALLAGLLIGTERSSGLALAGWLSVVLVRRDGPLWATVIVLLACAVLPATPSAMWSQLRRNGRVAVVAAVLVAATPVLWRHDTLFNILMAAAPLGLIVVQALTQVWPKCVTGPRQRTVAFVAGALMLVGVIAIAATIRPGGFDATLLQLVIGNTPDHLSQLVGILGWLDTPVPSTAVLLFWAMFGGLVTVAFLDRTRSATVAVAGLVGIVIIAWILELGQGLSYGGYWQGRYSMPAAIGLPLIAVWRPSFISARGASRAVTPGAVDRLRPVLAIVFFIVVNAAMIASQHRWAGGAYGTWIPWRWNTWGSPVAPLLLIAVHVAASGTLAMMVGSNRLLDGRSDGARVPVAANDQP